MTVVLVVTAGIFVRSFIGLTQIPIGFDPRNGVALRVSLTGPRYGSDLQVRGYAAALLERARATPGVRDAAIGSSAPLTSGPAVYFVVPGRPRPAPSEEPRAIIRTVSPDYFRTLAIPITAGRAFTTGDAEGAMRVAIVNHVLAGTPVPGRGSARPHDRADSGCARTLDTPSRTADHRRRVGEYQGGRVQ